MTGDEQRDLLDGGGAGLVLVVEDEFLIAMELEATLTAAGYEVLGPVATAAEALGLLSVHAPDGAVLDVNLGDHRVTAVAQELATRNIPFVVASAYSQLDLQNEPLLSRAVNVGKPTLPDRLLLEVGRMLGGPQR